MIAARTTRVNDRHVVDCWSVESSGCPTVGRHFQVVRSTGNRLRKIKRINYEKFFFYLTSNAIKIEILKSIIELVVWSWSKIINID